MFHLFSRPADLANVHSIPGLEKNIDPWKEIDLTKEKSIDRPIKLKKHTKLPLSIINNEVIILL